MLHLFSPYHPLTPLQNVHDIVQEAIENARFVCEEHYAMFKGPPVQLICPPNLTFPYVPGHLSHICFELLKNSLRAVVERFGVDNEDRFPPIKVIVVEGKEDITIKISDEGGGDITQRDPADLDIYVHNDGEPGYRPGLPGERL